MFIRRGANILRPSPDLLISIWFVNYGQMRSGGYSPVWYSYTAIFGSAQSPVDVQVRLPVKPANPDVAYTASRNAWRGIWSVPSSSWTATFSIAAKTMFVAS